MKYVQYLAYICLFIALLNCSKDGKEEISSNPLRVSDNELINYSSYCNDRFDMCIDYPSNFGAKPEPINGDGRTFINRVDSAQIILYGYIDQSNEGLETQLDIINEYVEIDDLKEISNGYEIYGTNRENNEIHRERILLKADSTAGTYADGSSINVITSLQFTYPVDKANKYDKYWTKINGKFN